MAASLPTQSILQAPEKHNDAQLELIWSMGLASLDSNNGELVLPELVETFLTKDHLEALKLRLSDHIGAPTIAFADLEAKVFRIMRVPALKAVDKCDPKVGLNSGSGSSKASAIANTPTPAYKLKAQAKKAKVPRPPNAFILYRKEHHPRLKSANPDYHNNEISVVLGKKWKAEPEEVKARYKCLADKIKAKHHVDHPDYQYAPRKASEKKRRMTARKAAEMAAEQAEDMAFMEHESDAYASPSASLEPSDVEGPFNTPNSSTPFPDPAGDMFGAEQVLHAPLPTEPLFSLDEYGNLEMTFPIHEPDERIMQVADAHNNYVQQFVPQHLDTPTFPDFADSMIDWELLERDFNQAKEASLLQNQILVGGKYVTVSDEESYAYQQAEIKRTAKWFY